MFISDKQAHIKNNMIKIPIIQCTRGWKTKKKKSTATHSIAYVLLTGNTNHSSQSSAEWGLEKILPGILGCI